jgi:hypothetical protein
MLCSSAFHVFRKLRKIYIFFEQLRLRNVLATPLIQRNTMTSPHHDLIATMAHDLFAKRQRLIKASQANMDVFDDRSAKALQEEYRRAEAEYLDAKAAFARAMKEAKRAA